MKINYGRHSIDQHDIDQVVQVLRSDFLTQGNQVPNFESDFSKRVESDFCVMVNSATSALHLCCLAIDLGPGDIAWTSANSFVASANCALYCGASVEFVDIDSNSRNLCVQHLEEKLIKSELNGCLPKVVIPVHFGGLPCDMKRIRKLADRYGFYLIEDASHALGAQYEGVPVGACSYSDLSVFSFHPVKMITSGEGGCITTNNASLYEKLTHLRTHGIIRNQATLSEPWFYDQISLGYNYRMTDLQASLGRSQLQRLNTFVDKRRCIAHQYNSKLSELNLKRPVDDSQKTTKSSYHLYVIECENTETRLKLYKHLHKHDIIVNVHYKPIYKHSYHSRLQEPGFKLNNAEEYYNKALSLPIYFDLDDEKFAKVCSVITDFYHSEINRA